MDFEAFALTDVGAQRDHNEDFMLSDPDAGLFVVCDGMGGHNAGEIASAMTVRAIARVTGEMRAVVDAVEAGKQPPSRLGAVLRTAVETACQEVYDAGRADPSKHGMGCTCTAVLLVGSKAVLGHVGDSRLYLCRSGTVTQLSEDHTFIAEAIKAGVLSPEEAAECGHRNVILRAIGKERTVMVDTLVFDLGPGDVLLLCSDGLHNYFRDPNELALYLSDPDGISSAPARLIGLANQRGGSDNITAVAVRMKAPAVQAGAPTQPEVVRGIDVLKKVELLRDLSMAEIVRFKQIFQDVNYPAGAFVVREGEVNDQLFVLVQGSAEVTRGGQLIANLQGGAHFGEMSLLNNRPRSATVRALEPCRMLATGRERLYALLQQDGMLAAKFFWKLASTLSDRLDAILAQQTQHPQHPQQVPGPAYYSGIYQRPAGLGG